MMHWLALVIKITQNSAIAIDHAPTGACLTTPTHHPLRRHPSDPQRHSENETGER